MRHLARDIARAVRTHRRHPAFAVVALIILAIGLGANVAIFSLVDGVFLRPLPWIRDPGGLVELTAHGNGQSTDLSYPVFRGLDGSRSVGEDVAAYASNPVSVGSGESAVPRLGVAVTARFFPVLGVAAQAGRLFETEEASFPRVAPVAVVSDRLWRDQLGADPAAIGRMLPVNGASLQIIGVLPRGFRGTAAGLQADVYVPIGVAVPGFPTAASLADAEAGELQVLARLPAGRSRAATAASLSAAARGALLEAGVATVPPRFGVAVERFSPVSSEIREGVTALLAALLIVSGLLFVMTCANVAGMLLSRVAERQGEISVRLALGATRARIAQQLVVEATVLFVTAGLVSVVLASWLVPLLTRLRPPLPAGISIDLPTAVDWRVVAYASTVAAIAGIVFTLAPALRAARGDASLLLRDHVGMRSRAARRSRSILVGGQMALTVVLLVVASLFGKALASSRSIDPGWNADGVWLTTLDLDAAGINSTEGAALYDAIAARVRGLSGVVSAALAAKVPFAGQSQLGPVNVEGIRADEGTAGFPASFNRVSADYFRTMRIPLLQGRDIAESDREGMARVVVVNRAMAERFWPRGGAVGRTFWVGPVGAGQRYQVVGVAADTKYHRLGEDTPNFYFIPYRQRYNAQMTLHVRLAPGAAGAEVRRIRAAIVEMAPAVPVDPLRPLDEVLSVYFLPQRVAAWAAGLVGVIAALVGLAGVYGMAALSVTQRRRELGVRLALGARPRDVVALVLREESRSPAVGLLAGFILAASATHALRAFLGTVRPLDPAVYLAVAVGAITATAVALAVPVRRVAFLDPSSTLRD